MPEIDLELSLKEKLKNTGISGVCFDLDDTLLNTNNDFGMWMRRFVSAATEKSGLDWNVAWSKLVEINNQLHQTHFVKIDRLTFAAEKLDEFLGTTPLFANHSDLLLAIYTHSPKKFDGTDETLEDFKNSGLKMALVTHAEVDWTNLKIDQNDIRKYFDHIEIADAGRHKNSQDWAVAINKLGLTPSQVLIVGDNKIGDILAAIKIGVPPENCICIESPWEVYNAGQLPEGVVLVKNIKEIVPVLIKKL